LPHPLPFSKGEGGVGLFYISFWYNFSCIISFINTKYANISLSFWRGIKGEAKREMLFCIYKRYNSHKSTQYRSTYILI